MSLSITIKKRDGSERRFEHQGRSGGSYSIRLSFEAGFAIVTDEYGQRTVIPESIIEEIVEVPLR